MKKINKRQIKEEIQLISFHNYINKRSLIFKKTCSASPCQYDIFDNWNMKKIKYYGRLRWGYFYVAKEPCGKPIYEFDFKRPMDGFFKNTEEEIYHLKKACMKIWSKNIK